MQFYLHHIPKWYQALKPKYRWRYPHEDNDNVLYLSFDDGPIPGVTPWVLDCLKTYNAKASFFCIGDNAQKHPAILAQIVEDGHSLGNHTFNHFKGSQYSTEAYLENTALCAKEFQSKLFRPPYGRIKKAQAKGLRAEGFEIIMWDVLAGDWDSKLSAEDCVKQIKKRAKPGSIIVFHDSIKAWPRLKIALEEILEYYQEKGFRFEAIRPQSTAIAE
ncbi:MAG: polysaccharide deacetylase family protein [Bacteroidetes bacterium]|nr:polysaccharide deacetylase family protein [Bacteroidota bacterium]